MIDELLQVWPHATNGSSTNDVVHFAGQCDGAEEICRVHFDHRCIEAWTNAIGYRTSVDSSVNPYAMRAFCVASGATCAMVECRTGKRTGWSAKE